MAAPARALFDEPGGLQAPNQLTPRHGTKYNRTFGFGARGHAHRLAVQIIDPETRELRSHVSELLADGTGKWKWPPDRFQRGILVRSRRNRWITWCPVSAERCLKRSTLWSESTISMGQAAASYV